MKEVSVSEVFSHSDYLTVYPEGMELHFWNRARNKIVYRLLHTLVEADELVLDVGCGTGIFLGYLQGKNIHARGVEKGTPGIKPSMAGIIDTDTDLFGLPQELKSQIKVIVLLDVIEHIKDPRQFLEQIYREIPSCVNLVITVPARMELWSNYDQDWGHFTRYTRANLSEELSVSGFMPIRCHYCFHWVYLVMLVMNSLGIKRKTRFKSPSRNMIVNCCHRILGALTYLEYRLFPGVVPGSSIVCMASRRSNL